MWAPEEGRGVPGPACHCPAPAAGLSHPRCQDRKGVLVGSPCSRAAALSSRGARCKPRPGRSQGRPRGSWTPGPPPGSGSGTRQLRPCAPEPSRQADPGAADPNRRRPPGTQPAGGVHTDPPPPNNQTPAPEEGGSRPGPAAPLQGSRCWMGRTHECWEPGPPPGSSLWPCSGWRPRPRRPGSAHLSWPRAAVSRRQARAVGGHHFGLGLARRGVRPPPHPFLGVSSAQLAAGVKEEDLQANKGPGLLEARRSPGGSTAPWQPGATTRPRGRAPSVRPQALTPAGPLPMAGATLTLRDASPG